MRRRKPRAPRPTNPNRRENIRAKIMAKVKICPASGCWIWTGGTSGTGRGGHYARMSLDGGTVAVHRTLWINEFGAIPPRKQLDHTCTTRGCVNPAHLELVTHLQNMRRRDAN